MPEPPSHSRRQRTAVPNATHGSSTITTTPAAGPSVSFSTPTLRLRAESDAQSDPAPSTRRRIQWAEDVVDNEGMGKKSSKVCCIYHKPREAGESSGEDSSSDSSDSSSDDSDSGKDTSRAQPANRRSNRHYQHDHDGPESSAKGKQKERSRSPNAYERVPKKKQPREPK